ncbi:adenylate/guanylate cyclase domain-containing protein [Sphingoaurantiacus capsulatus]|uniref:Adenylate/guanylate cyclase domain-containing protein n=1 Tax=Sphingoaurantiacus capsulatus TaxID=1771310 RepID=A0ABV7X9U9_9SPHN
MASVELTRDAAPAAGDSGRALFWRMVVVYHLASLAAVVVTLLLVFLGLEFTGWQWACMFIMLAPGIAFYTSLDVVVIRRHLKPIGDALAYVDRGETPPGLIAIDGVVRALNLPFMSALRVTLLHGPAATFAASMALVLSNLVLDGNFALWQIVTFAATVLFFASPTHAIFEYFVVSRDVEPIIGRLTRAAGGAIPAAEQHRLIAVRLKTKLLYLAIFVTSLPLLFFAASFLFKLDRLLISRGVTVDAAGMMPLYVWIGGVMLLCMAGSVIMAVLTANEVSRSAARMIDAMREVEGGRLDEAQLDVISTDEYADLYRGFSLMLASLREEQRILEISHDLVGELKLDLLIARIMKATAELLGAERSTLFVHDAKNDELFSVYAAGVEMREIRIPSTQGIAGSVFASGASENIDDPYADPRFSPEVDRQTGFRTESILCVPISNKAGVRIGVAQVLNKRGGAFTSRDEARLRAFSAQIAVCLENAQLFDDVLSMKNYNESILKSTSNGIVTLDADGRIVTANDAALAVLAAQRDGLVGAPANDVFAGVNRWVAERLEKTQATGETSLAVDAQIERTAGGTASVNLTAMPLIDAAEQRIGSMLVLEDITSEKRVRSTMARYMSKEVADQLLAGGESELGGKDQKVSVMFSDVRSFTTISEALGARDTVTMLNEYFTEMVDVIFQHGGILDKYIGDAIMALFGAPFNGPQDADNALAVANQMMVKLAELNERRAVVGRAAIDIGIGISTGEVIVGNIGSAKRMEYTVIGDNVNLASRLEGATKQYGVKILLSESTVRELTQPALLREIDVIRVKGKDRPVAVYESLGFRDEAAIGDLLGEYGAGLAAYRARDWKAAAKRFEAALKLMPGDRPSAMYLDRARAYAAAPPAPDWDGVWTLTSK